MRKSKIYTYLNGWGIYGISSDSEKFFEDDRLIEYVVPKEITRCRDMSGFDFQVEKKNIKDKMPVLFEYRKVNVDGAEYKAIRRGCALGREIVDQNRMGNKLVVANVLDNSSLETYPCMYYESKDFTEYNGEELDREYFKNHMNDKVKLPSDEPLKVGNIINEESVIGFINEPKTNRYEVLASLLISFLNKSDGTPTIICDEKDNIIFWISAITFLFPLESAKEIYFNTYSDLMLDKQGKINSDADFCGVFAGDEPGYNKKIIVDSGKFVIFDLLAEKYPKVNDKNRFILDFIRMAYRNVNNFRMYVGELRSIYSGCVNNSNRVDKKLFEECILTCGLKNVDVFDWEMEDIEKATLFDVVLKSGNDDFIKTIYENERENIFTKSMSTSIGQNTCKLLKECIEKNYIDVKSEINVLCSKLYNLYAGVTDFNDFNEKYLAISKMLGRYKALFLRIFSAYISEEEINSIVNGKSDVEKKCFLISFLKDQLSSEELSNISDKMINYMVQLGRDCLKCITEQSLNPKERTLYTSYIKTCLDKDLLSVKETLSDPMIRFTDSFVQEDDIDLIKQLELNIRELINSCSRIFEDDFYVCFTKRKKIEDLMYASKVSDSKIEFLLKNSIRRWYENEYDRENNVFLNDIVSLAKKNKYKFNSSILQELFKSETSVKRQLQKANSLCKTLRKDKYIVGEIVKAVIESNHVNIEFIRECEDEEFGIEIIEILDRKFNKIGFDTAYKIYMYVIENDKMIGFIDLERKYEYLLVECLKNNTKLIPELIAKTYLSNVNGDCDANNTAAILAQNGYTRKQVKDLIMTKENVKYSSEKCGKDGKKVLSDLIAAIVSSEPMKSKNILSKMFNKKG